MITDLRVQNFKCFEDMTLHLGPLTLMAGTNASGKSSTIQSLLLLRQSYLRGLLQRGELLLNGSLASLGAARDVLYEDAATNEIAFAIRANSQADLSFTFSVQPGKSDIYRLRASEAPVLSPGGPLFATAFNYLNAERIGPRLTYPMAELRDENIDIGPQGEYTLDVLSRHRDQPVATAGMTYRDPESGSTPSSIEYQVRYWMQTIIPNFDFELDSINAADQVRVGFRIGTREYLRPTNIGFGLIYTLPIVVGALVAPAGSLFIVENPEAHLHPAGQSRIGHFLARAAAAGVQVLIETHSDHVLNGIRRAVRDKALLPGQVSLAFFSTSEDSATKVIQPKIYASGGIRPWPKGFFDQFERDLRELL
ncbi:DUF3696 domain-containing protein [Chloroflexales bacterium ZM16-3]|nr:DUF3696 domain-containing protein [Chloroflexales bacterium ZM16-3]